MYLSLTDLKTLNEVSPTWTCFRKKAFSPCHRDAVNRCWGLGEPDAGALPNTSCQSGADTKLRIVGAQVQVACDVGQLALAERRGGRVCPVRHAQGQIVAVVGNPQNDGVPVGVVQAFKTM